ncbi:MAG: GAF domain-containing protein, partial [bacterium]
MDAAIAVFLVLGFVLEVILIYYRQRIDLIPIFFTFFPFYLFIKGISDLSIFLIILISSLITFILKEFTINFDANTRIKLYNIFSKFLFVFFVVSFLFLLSLMNTKSFLSFVIFFLVFGYFYTLLGMGFIVSLLEKDLIYRFSSYFDNVLKEKDFLDEDARESVLMLTQSYVKTDKGILPYRFGFFEYFLLSIFVAIFYFYYIFAKVDDILSYLVVFQVIYFAVLLFFRIIYNYIVYSIAENFLKMNISEVINKYEINFLDKKIKDLEVNSEKLSNWLRYLGEFYSKLDDNPDYEDLYSGIYAVLSKSLNFSRFIIFISEGEVSNLRLVFTRGIGKSEFYTKSTAVEVACNSMKSVYYFGGTLFSALALFKDDRSFICSPIKIGKKLIGVIYLSSLNTRNFSEEDVKFVEILADKFAVMYVLYQEYSKSKEMAIKDGLTGLYTHRHFQELLSKEIENAKLYGYPVCLLMIDT